MRIALVVIALLLLSGCTTTRPLPPAVDDAGVEEYLARQLDAEWALVGLSEAQRPHPARVRFVSTTEFTDVMSKCVLGSTGGYRRVLSQQTADDLAYYYCQAQYPIDPNEYLVLSVAQINYLYDYYIRWTIPCLESNGYLVRNVPSRMGFIRFSGYWNPVYHEGSTVDISSDEYTRLDRACGISVIDRFPTQ